MEMIECQMAVNSVGVMQRLERSVDRRNRRIADDAASIRILAVGEETLKPGSWFGSVFCALTVLTG